MVGERVCALQGYKPLVCEQEGSLQQSGQWAESETLLTWRRCFADWRTSWSRCFQLGQVAIAHVRIVYAECVTRVLSFEIENATGADVGRAECRCCFRLSDCNGLERPI